ncbi:MAG: DUF4143 domain-containing protein [Kineosporiaceae bacterium]
MTGPDGYLPRHLEARLDTALRSAPAVLLDGPRGVGKTTTAARRAASSVLLPRDLELLRADPEGYLSALRPPVLLDEWQLAGTDLLWTVKRLVDDNPEPGQFLLTGSVEPATYGPTYPLTGRAAHLLLRPMTRAELAGTASEQTFLAGVMSEGPPSPGQDRAPVFDLAALGTPGFPAMRASPEPRLALDAYAHLVAQRAGEEGRDATRLLRTMRVLATLSGQAAPDQRVWDAADINKATWKHYDDLLVRTHVAAPVAAFESNRLARLTSYPKRFLADTALTLALAEMGVDQLRQEPTSAGRLLESYVAQQLRPQVDALRGNLFHVRTGAGEREVDFVVEVGGTVVGIEVKLTRRPGPADAGPLAWLRDRLGERFAHGLVVHTGGDCYALGDRLVAVPLGLVEGRALRNV